MYTNPHDYMPKPKTLHYQLQEKLWHCVMALILLTTFVLVS